MFGHRFVSLRFSPYNRVGDGRAMVMAHPSNCLIIGNIREPEPCLVVENLIRPELLTARARIEDLERRNRAARLAIDRLTGLVAAVPTDVAAELRNVEKPLEAVVDILDDLADRADHEEEIMTKTKGLPFADGEVIDDTTDNVDVIKIVKNGSSIQWLLMKGNGPVGSARDFHMNFLTIVSAASGTGRLGFGSWYRAIQAQLVENSRGMERILNILPDGRISMRFLRTVIRALKSAAEIYVGHRSYSAFEASVMCLFQYNEAKKNSSNRDKNKNDSQPQVAGTFEEAIKLVPYYLGVLQEDIRKEWGAVSYAFDRSKMPSNFFSPVGSKKYSPGAFDTHVVHRLFKAHGVFAATSRDVTRDEITFVDPDFQRFDDPIANLSLAFFPARREPLLLHEDEPLMRATINSVSLLMLMQRLMFNGDVYTNSRANRFQAAAFFEDKAGPTQLEYGECLAEDTDKFRAPGSRPAAATKTAEEEASRDVVSMDNNIVFLFEKYLLPLYRYDNRTEVTGFFPGLTAICLTGRVKGIPGTTALGDYQTSLANLVDLDLRRTENTGAGAAVVLTVHDAITFDLELGLARLLSVFDVKKHMKTALKSMNVETDSDLIYFLCLGCIPYHVAI
ncbi:Capsid vertex component 2 [Cacatuid alphaherpesvirus 2]|uniref:Capsid vertex component 2 n=1 Tax=Cacatuid alphaherpesvirus 2 TaxID=2604840 RepID=A0A5B9RBB8_9ALPH|nr:Capsid vertex component 2 [Cacatuid alphaherpesvirus 2]QEG54055.1 Capsid vertex component 2 [Cacatuid alphaherpesvirus 2]